MIGSLPINGAVEHHKHPKKLAVSTHEPVLHQNVIRNAAGAEFYEGLPKDEFP